MLRPEKEPLAALRVAEKGQASQGLRLPGADRLRLRHPGGESLQPHQGGVEEAGGHPHRQPGVELPGDPAQQQAASPHPDSAAAQQEQSPDPRVRPREGRVEEHHGGVCVHARTRVCVHTRVPSVSGLCSQLLHRGGG